MTTPIKRESYKQGFGPAVLRETVPVPVVVDNLVCGVCGASLDRIAWCMASSPKRKGIVVFACEKHVSGAMNMLAKVIEGLSPVHEGLRLPDEKQN